MTATCKATIRRLRVLAQINLQQSRRFRLQGEHELARHYASSALDYRATIHGLKRIS